MSITYSKKAQNIMSWLLKLIYHSLLGWTNETELIKYSFWGTNQDQVHFKITPQKPHQKFFIFIF